MSGMKWVILMSLQKPSFGGILEKNCPEKLDKTEQTATLMEFLFSEFADLQIVNLLKKSFHRKCFLMNYVKFFKTAVLITPMNNCLGQHLQPDFFQNTFLADLNF